MCRVSRVQQPSVQNCPSCPATSQRGKGRNIISTNRISPHAHRRAKLRFTIPAIANKRRRSMPELRNDNHTPLETRRTRPYNRQRTRSVPQTPWSTPTSTNEESRNQKTKTCRSCRFRSTTYAAPGQSLSDRQHERRLRSIGTRRAFITSQHASSTTRKQPLRSYSLAWPSAYTGRLHRCVQTEE